MARKLRLVPNDPWVVRKDGQFLKQDRSATHDVYGAGVWPEDVAQQYAERPGYSALPRERAIQFYSDTRQSTEERDAEIARLRVRLAELGATGDSDSMNATNSAAAVEAAETHLGIVATFLDMDRLADTNRPAIVEGVNDTDRWHRNAGMRFYPLLFTNSETVSKFDAYVRQNLLADMPALPRIFHFDKPTLTFGSCFASRIRDYLKSKQSTSDNVWIPEGLNNTYALLSYFEWALSDDREKLKDTAFIKTADGRIVNWADGAENEMPQIRAALKSAGGFIFTLGMTEIWRHKETKAVFWRGVPREAYDADLHEPYQSTFEDNLKNVSKLIKLIRQEIGPVPIVLTVSPVTLTATFRGTSAIMADCASKCTLRAVVEQIMLDGPDNVYYWPSFEMVRWLGAHLEKSTYTLPSKDVNGKVITDSGHVPDWVVAGIIENFVNAAFHQLNEEDASILR